MLKESRSLLSGAIQAGRALARRTRLGPPRIVVESVSSNLKCAIPSFRSECVDLPELPQPDCGTDAKG